MLFRSYQFGLGHYALASRNGDIEVHDARSHRVEMTWTPEGAGLPRSSLLSGFEFLRDGRHVLTSFKDSTFVAWELGRLYGVSRRTIARDLRELVQRGQVPPGVCPESGALHD